MNSIRSSAARLCARLLAVSTFVAGIALPGAAFAGELPNITTIAGTGQWGYWGDDAPATTVPLGMVSHVTVVPDGRVVWTEMDNMNRVRQMTPDGTLNLYKADNGVTVTVGAYNPVGMVSDSAGNLYIADNGNSRILKVTPAGVTSVIAGGNGAGFGGDGGLAVNAQLNWPRDLWRLADGTIFIADTGNRRIRKISPAGVISTVAGNGEYTDAGDGASALAASFKSPRAVTVDFAGNIYVADDEGNRIRRIVAATGKIEAFAGRARRFGRQRSGGQGAAVLPL